MGYDTSASSQEIEEASPGAGATTDEINPNPGQTTEFIVVRTDASPTEEWSIDVQASPDPDNAGWAGGGGPPVRSFPLTANQVRKEFLLPSRYAYRIRVVNDDASPTEKVKAMVYWRGDGVSL